MIFFVYFIFCAEQFRLIFFYYYFLYIILLFLGFGYLKPLTPTQWHYPSSTPALVDLVGFCSDFPTLNYRLALTHTHIYHFAWRQHNSFGLVHLRARAFIHRLAEKSLIQWVRRGIACANSRHNISKTYVPNKHSDTHVDLFIPMRADEYVCVCIRQLFATS